MISNWFIIIYFFRSNSMKKATGIHFIAFAFYRLLTTCVSQNFFRSTASEGVFFFNFVKFASLCYKRNFSSNFFFFRRIKAFFLFIFFCLFQTIVELLKVYFAYSGTIWFSFFVKLKSIIIQIIIFLSFNLSFLLLLFFFSFRFCRITILFWPIHWNIKERKAKIQNFLVFSTF